MEDDKAPSESSQEEAMTMTTDSSATIDMIKPPSVPSHFPDKLMALLEKKVAPEAVWWLRDTGEVTGAFAINRKIFSEQLLNKAFNGNKWPSITRNLNRWGYKQISYPNLPPHTTAYFHPLFQPKNPDLLKTMTQYKSKAKAAIQLGELKRAQESAPSRAGAGATSGAADNPSTMMSSHGHTSLGDALIEQSPPGASLQQGVRHGAQLFQAPPNDASRRLGTSSIRSPIGSPTGQPRNIVASPQPHFHLADANQLQLALLQNPSSTHASHDPVGGEDTRALLQAMLSRQEVLAGHAQQQQRNQQELLHQESAVSATVMVSQSNMLQQLQQQDALLLQLEVERQQRQGHQLAQPLLQQQQARGTIPTDGSGSAAAAAAAAAAAGTSTTAAPTKSPGATTPAGAAGAAAPTPRNEAAVAPTPASSSLGAPAAAANDTAARTPPC